MPEGQELEAQFVQHLPVIERLIGSLCRRHGMRGADAEDAASWIKTRIVESQYHLFKQFRGESAITTYLTVAIAMLFRDYEIQLRGRWRPSAAAQRAGPLAMRLERLVRRDGMHTHEAGELLRTAGETNISDRALSSLLASIPERPPLRPVELAETPDVDAAGDFASDDAMLQAETDNARHDAGARLGTALKRLSPEDQVMIRMRFWEGRCVSDISRALGVPQKRLYRRLERALVQVRRALEADGLSRELVMSFLRDESQ
jgi:RNA polymerase sigma factor (sigma-70 family)